MTIVPYEEKFAPAIREICLRTAGVDETTDLKSRRYTLAMYCDAYLSGETAFVLLDGDTPKGYILCAERFAEYARRFAPYRAEIETLGGVYPLMARAEQALYALHSEEYPAHLHIDILESHTGKGGGRALMQTLLAHLRRAGVSGVMLGVSVKNTRAIAFYRKMGFSQLSGDENVLVLGQHLCGEGEKE